MVRTPRPSQLGNKRRRILPRRITQRNHSGNEQLLCRSHRDNEYAEAFCLKFFNHRRRRRTRLGNCRDHSKSALDDLHWPAVSADHSGFGHFSRGIESREGDELPPRHIRRVRGGADGGVQGVCPAIRTRQSCHRQNLRLVEARQGATGGYHEFIACQCSGLVGAEDVHSRRFIERRKTRR